MISEPDREPTTESSFDDGADAVSDEEVEADVACIDCRWPCPAKPPLAEPFGADVVLVSCLRCGAD